MAKRVMVVDDSRIQEIHMHKLLEGSDYEVAAYFRDGESALDGYEEAAPDVVTIDIIMPGVDGLETARVLLEEHPEARIVMVSSLDCPEAREEAGWLKTRGFVAKPFEREQLLQALDQALAD